MTGAKDSARVHTMANEIERLAAK
jgi:hypothetical protein